MTPDPSPQPTEGVRRWLRRLWRSRRQLPTKKRWLLTWVVVVGVLFLAAAALTAATAKDVGVVLEIGIGTTSPFVTRADVPAVLVATLGYLLLPALIGLVIGAFMEEFVARSVMPRGDIERKVTEALGAKVKSRIPPK